MNEIIKLTSVESINEDIERFSGKVFKVINDSFNEDFPDRKQTFLVSRTINKKLFLFLMDRFRDEEKVSLEFIKKELKSEVNKKEFDTSDVNRWRDN